MGDDNQTKKSRRGPAIDPLLKRQSDFTAQNDNSDKISMCILCIATLIIEDGPVVHSAAKAFDFRLRITEMIIGTNKILKVKKKKRKESKKGLMIVIVIVIIYLSRIVEK